MPPGTAPAHSRKHLLSRNRCWDPNQLLPLRAESLEESGIQFKIQFSLKQLTVGSYLPRLAWGGHSSIQQNSKVHDCSGSLGWKTRETNACSVPLDAQPAQC